MMNTEDVLIGDLTSRIKNMRVAIDNAQACLDGNDFLQCAVRLQDAAVEAKFDTLLLNIYDSMSE